MLSGSQKGSEKKTGAQAYATQYSKQLRNSGDKQEDPAYWSNGVDDEQVDEVLSTLFELGNAEKGSVLIEVEGGRDQDLAGLIRQNSRALAKSEGQDAADDKIILPIRIDDKFYYLNLTNFECPEDGEDLGTAGRPTKAPG